jgi:lysozyme
MSPASRKSVYEQLKIDEGVVYKTYEDSLGYLTFGVGHLVLSSDPEYRAALGTTIDEDRVHEVFEFDLDLHISECSKLYGCYWDGFPDEIQEILVNMCFNMGRTRLGKFKKMTAAMQNKDWVTAAKEGRDSAWYGQVGNRSERLMTRMENFSE